jgi:pilus assembly protein CpaF
VIRAPGAGDTQVFAEFVSGFFAPIEKLLLDPEVSEVLINGFEEVHVERGGRLSRASCSFDSEASLLSALRATAQYLGRPLDERNPMLEGRLPDGSRLQAVLAPMAEGGPCVAIRRHQKSSHSFQQPISWGALNQASLDYIQALVLQKKNLLVSGGTGSGKTSLLRCVAGLTPVEERIVTIEDARELALSLPHVVSLEARPPDSQGLGRVTIRDLFLATLRMRPDRIVIGELRAGEALELIQAMTSGHGGCLSTIHASSPGDALRRLETLALLSGIELPLIALRAQVASAVDAIIQVERRADGGRWVRCIAEVHGLKADGTYQVRAIWERRGGRGELLEAAGVQP